MIEQYLQGSHSELLNEDFNDWPTVYESAKETVRNPDEVWYDLNGDSRFITMCSSPQWRHQTTLYISWSVSQRGSGYAMVIFVDIFGEAFTGWVVPINIAFCWSGIAPGKLWEIPIYPVGNTRP